MEARKLVLSIPVDERLKVALVNLTVPIVVESTQVRGFHNDPADQIIVATAKVYDCLLLTADRKILNYSEIKTLK